MWKKICYFLVISVLCAGCANDKSNKYDGSKTEARESNKQQQSADVKPVDDSNSVDILYDLAENSIKLYDLQNQKVLKELECKDNEMVQTVGICEDGYFAVKSIQTGAGETKGSDEVVVISGGDTQMEDYVITFYNAALQEKNHISMISYFKTEQLDLDELSGCIPVISKDTTKAAWVLSDSIYCFDLEKQKGVFLKSHLEENVIIDQVVFVGDDILGFMGVQGISETDTSYGYIDVNKDTITVHNEKDYLGFSLFTSGDYLFMNDGEDPDTGTSSGKIVILDCTKNQVIKLGLDGIESTLAMVTEDGKELIAVKTLDEKSFRIRCYEVSTGNVLKEKECRKNMKVRPASIKKMYDGKYGIIYFDDKGEAVENATDD